MFISMMLANLKENIGNKKEYWEAFTVNNLMSEFMYLYPLSAQEKELITIEVNNNFLIYADRMAVINVFNNLMNNTLYFIKAARKGKISIRVEKDKKQHIIIFEDTAQGVSKRQLHKLFDMFQSSRQGGTGLGLVACKRIMKSFGGDIRAESVEGEYMRFILSFPDVEETEDESE